MNYEQLGQQIGKLVDEKNKAYGDAHGKTGDFLRLLYPDGIKPEQYGDALTIVRIWDKLSRIATDKDALGESPYKDIAGYGLLGAMKAEPETKTKQSRVVASSCGTFIGRFVNGDYAFKCNICSKSYSKDQRVFETNKFATCPWCGTINAYKEAE